LGVKSYYEKTGAFKSLGIALSGGRDSMLTLMVAWRAAQLMGAGAVPIHAFYMPSRHSQEATREAAEVLARELGASLQVVPIDEATDREIAVVTDMLGGQPPTELAAERPGAPPRAAHVELVQHVGRAVPPQTSDAGERLSATTMGGTSGRAVGHRQRAEDGGGRPAAPAARFRFTSQPRWPPSQARAEPTRSRPGTVPSPCSTRASGCAGEEDVARQR
jgi:hypothetical protein